MVRRAAVLGTGLIGASIGIGLRRLGWSVAGWDPDAEALASATEMAAIDDTAVSADRALLGTQLVVLAGPVSSIIEQVGELDTDAVVTDVAGVKTPVVRTVRDGLRLVGGHPMAGRETSGPSGASGSMFRGATWVLTTDGATADDLGAVEAVVRDLGANPVRMTAAEHDAAVGLASHLPHLVAASLVRTVASDSSALGLAAGGFRDLTRIAMSDPGWWVDVLVSNRASVSKALRGMATDLGGLADAVEGGDGGRLRQVLADARRERADMAAPVATVSVLLDDQPGEIARVGHALSESGVDLRDLQLRHAMHGGGGVLTLSVRTGEQALLRKALRRDGFRVVG